jgi:phage anti-repressor protein
MSGQLLTVFDFIEQKKINIDKKYMDMFWDVMGGDWMYLGSSMILNHMTDEKGKDALHHFYKRVLQANYVENIEYKRVSRDHELVKKYMKANNIKLTDTSNRKLYYAITVRALKKLLMTSKTTAGHHTREYFVQVEELYIQYIKYQCEHYKSNWKRQIAYLKEMEHITNYSRMNRIVELESRIKDKCRVGCVYFIQEELTKNVKIGWCWSLPERLSQLQTGNSQKLTVVKSILCQYPHLREHELHAQHKKYHLRGEWYSVDVLASLSSSSSARIQ